MLEQTDSFAVVPHPVDMEEAEKLKNRGNAHMQNKEFELAVEQYTAALKLSPAGPQSHVYFSNRAAALVSLKKFQDAIADSERSLALKPDYSKAHARLGLAHFLLGNYRQAVEAYTVSLKYEPDNKSSRTYLEKSAKKLAESGEGGVSSSPIATSYSVVSEWDKHNVSAALEEAERYKNRGNALMQSRDYTQAVSMYTRAIQLNPAGPQSYTYFSNRAAALCYLELYADAEEDSLQSLQLKPDYAKAYARLGLSRFFLKNYVGSVEAYTKALEYDPDNAASKSYRAKAMAKLAATQGVV
jgi:tetratricopeptide (TPR) repeat protein